MHQEIRILIVEDEALAAEMLWGMLEERGYAVIGKAVNGAQAVELTQSLRPELVLMDIDLPGGLDGIEAARQINEVCPTPVVILTAYETPELVARASAAGVGGYLTKLPDANVLDRVIAIAMARFDDLRELRRLNAELQQALAEIKTLRGIIPICASCKKIRDDEGYWHDVAVYIRDHSEAEFSHGICPDCGKKLYPEFYRDK